jgi:glutathione S-transferase
MSLTHYWNRGAQPCRAVESLLVAGEIPHELKSLDMYTGENRTPEMLALNPSGRLPFIVVADRPIGESAAILRFLAQQYPSLNQYYPADLFVRAKIDAALDLNGLILRPNLCFSILPIIFAKDGIVDEFTQK